MRRRGRYADGLITDPKTRKQHKTEFEAGARAAGKDPSQMPVLVERYVIAGDKRDAEKAATVAVQPEGVHDLVQRARSRRNSKGALRRKFRWKRCTKAGRSVPIQQCT
jgi:alkanesulfonate monooxygenase SsuD/methylene tetrahydromethanopterin reductase-like flavin-dependent oxidoreductase (luciferase family)